MLNKLTYLNSAHKLADLFSDLSLLGVELSNAPVLHQGKVNVFIVRADKIDGELGGNKYFKLLPNFQAARARGMETVLSFGGKWSNHLHALAAAGDRFGMRTIGIVRGERGEHLTPTLRDAQQYGMHVQHVSRQLYQMLQKPMSTRLLYNQFGPVYVVPQGGTNYLGVAGARYLGDLIAKSLPEEVGEIFLPCATGGTLAGVIAGISSRCQVTGINVLRNRSVEQDVDAYLQGMGVSGRRWAVMHQFDGGGYAKVNKALSEFVATYEEESQTLVDSVYMGKTLYAVKQMIEQGAIDEGQSVAIIHTGGLQGRRQPLSEMDY